MTVAQVSSGTQTCTIGTEHTLASPAGGKTHVLFLDVSALVGGDVLEVRLYAKTLTGSSLAPIDAPTTIAGPAAGTAFMSVPVPSAHGSSFTIKQTTGTGRAIPWSVQSLD